MPLNNKVKILLLGGNIWFFGEGLLGPLFAIFAQRIGGDILDISYAWAIYLIFAGILFILVGKIIDKYGHKEKIMIGGYALNTICTFGYLFVSNPLQLFIIQALLGIADAMATPTWDSLYSKYDNTVSSGLQWGLSGGLEKIVTGAAVLVGGYIIVFGSFTTLFIIMGSIQLIATIVQARILVK
ncbi:MAG: MFS transporter [Candidatus ainarchaeum sp.]|nr:MFS transporter [Candidatus ainarchaeum sp.]